MEEGGNNYNEAVKGILTTSGLRAYDNRGLAIDPPSSTHPSSHSSELVFDVSQLCTRVDNSIAVRTPSHRWASFYRDKYIIRDFSIFDVLMYGTKRVKPHVRIKGPFY